MNKVKTIICSIALVISNMPFIATASDTLCQSELLGANETLSQNNPLTDQQKTNLKKCIPSIAACDDYSSPQYGCQYIYNEITAVAKPTATPPAEKTTVTVAPIKTTTPSAPPPAPPVTPEKKAPASAPIPANSAPSKTNGNSQHPPSQINWL